jgi:hypothetical protein
MMNRRTLLGGALGGAAALAQPARSKPRNVIFVLTDDHPK